MKSDSVIGDMFYEQSPALSVYVPSTIDRFMPVAVVRSPVLRHLPFQPPCLETGNEMGEFIWRGISNPEAVIGPGDAPLVLALVVLIALFTWLFIASPGRWLMRRSRLAAFVSGTVFVPVSIVAIDLLMVATAPKGGGPNDGLGIAFAGLIVLALYAMPVGLVTSAIYIRRRRARNAD